MHRSFEDIKEAIAKIEEDEDAIPILLFLCRK